MLKSMLYKEVDGIRLKMDIYYPPKFNPAKSREKLPAIVLFHGGGWYGGDTNMFRQQSRYLAKRGMIAICPGYRTLKPHKATPDKCLQDAKSAMRYVYANADKLGIDDKKILAGGGSAGGQLAAATAFCDKFNDPNDDLAVNCVPKALVLFNPVIDNSSNGYGYDRVKDYWKDFSPMHNIGKNPPPTLFMLGDRDKHIPVAMAERYKKIMEDHGGRCDLIIYEGAEHAFFNHWLRKKYKRDFYAETLAAMDKFLVSLKYLSEQSIETKEKR